MGIEESEHEKVKEIEEKIRREFSQKIQDMESEVKVLTEAKVKLNHEIDAVVSELKNRDESVEKSVEVMEKRIQEITQENQKFKQEKMEIEKNKSMLEVTKAEENNPKLQTELDAMKIDYEI